MISNEEIIETLKTCNDPEIGVDVWTLGLIYELKINDEINIKMTFTTPFCPYGPMIVEEIKSKLSKFNVKVNIEIVFEPVWQPSDELRQLLGF
ncbi:metal-sulfur cluster assembly factor [Candidatus Woesearchaeota archaeon]|nr:metal-sulfur cluster assembly factor [Candidatus Woesearchaeota archaeon]